jgi:translocation and assembly module TamA
MLTEKRSDAEPGPPPVVLEIVAPDDLEELLRRHLQLAQLPQVLRGQALREGELQRLVALTPAQVRELVRTAGYFNAEVDVDSLGGDPPRVRVVVRPGPRSLVDDLHLDVEGPLAAATQRGEPHALQTQRVLRDEWPLPPGAAFTDEAWNRAKSGSLSRLRSQGYVGAEWRSTRALVDAATQRVDVSAIAESGPLYRIGELRIEGLNHHDASTVHNIADVERGAPATEEWLLDFQERLRKSNLFDRSTVTLSPDAADPASAPVLVSLSERKLQDVTVGIGIDANVGLRGTLEHTHRRLFGRPWIANNELELASDRQRWEGEVATHTLPGLYRNLVGGAVERLQSETDTVTSQRLRVGRSQETNRISRLAFAEAERSVKRSALRTERASSLALHYHGVWRDVDDVQLPTRGRVWFGQVGAGMARSSPGGAGPFARLYAKLQLYRPLGDTWFGNARVELGQVFARGDVLVPEPMRFRAGGEESVRGYAYRSLTPVVDGVEVSGKVLFTASVEAARPLLQRLPQLWGAVFVDAGNAARRWSELHPAVGFGVGLRYRSPIGPVKLDVAWGRETRRLRLHLTVGTTF